jgi:phage terminase large subunit GpA-like protein
VWQPVGGGHRLLHGGAVLSAEQVEDRGRLAGCARLFGRGRPEPSPGFCHFSAERGTDHFEQLPSEALLTSYSRGTPVREWRRKKGVRGEALDCRVYAFAALEALASRSLSLERGCERAEMLAAKAPA